MKASDLTTVATLLQDLAQAKIHLRDFEAIPTTAEPLLMTYEWPNPDPEAPAHSRRKYCTVRLNPKLDGENLMRDIEDNVRELLTCRVDRLQFALKQLGVDPDA